jgi:hypothetical protein
MLLMVIGLLLLAGILYFALAPTAPIQRRFRHVTERRPRQRGGHSRGGAAGVREPRTPSPQTDAAAIELPPPD